VSTSGKRVEGGEDTYTTRLQLNQRKEISVIYQLDRRRGKEGIISFHQYLGGAKLRVIIRIENITGGQKKKNTKGEILLGARKRRGWGSTYECEKLRSRHGTSEGVSSKVCYIEFRGLHACLSEGG